MGLFGKTGSGGERRPFMGGTSGLKWVRSLALSIVFNNLLGSFGNLAFFGDPGFAG
jgi:hypothetical protein